MHPFCTKGNTSKCCKNVCCLLKCYLCNHQCLRKTKMTLLIWIKLRQWITEATKECIELQNTPDTLFYKLCSVARLWQPLRRQLYLTCASYLEEQKQQRVMHLIETDIFVYFKYQQDFWWVFAKIAVSKENVYSSLNKLLNIFCRRVQQLKSEIDD